MKAVWSWLMEMVEVDRPVDADEGARALTAAGLEVEAVEAVGDGFSGVVVAEVAARRKHPDADKLTLVDLADGSGGTTEVVCGAPNVPEPGGRVLWARPGAELPGGMKIGKRAIKGVESAGMICSEKELGLGEDHDGIIVLAPADAGVALGAEAATALGLRDVVLEIGVPANRPDCLGHLGLARELAAHLGARFAPREPDDAGLIDQALEAASLVSVTIDDQVGCPRYVARIIDGVTDGRSPEWMRQRLRAVGVRPLTALVDVTNYVMFELGQPLHAFDYARVRGQRIAVRRAGQGEKLTTLDDVERTLEVDDLVICDGEGPVALAGVMGGGDSEVTAGTRRVLLEAASFQPIGVRRTARRLGLHSESSHRFERQVDPNLCDRASRRAAELLARLGGGRIAAGAVDVYPSPVAPAVVSVRASRTSALTGVPFTREQVGATLARLSLPSEPTGDDTLAVTCPTSRPDLTREVDLIEEVIRVHGFERVPATLPPHTVTPSHRPDRRARLARTALCGAGLSEAITFGFTSPERIAALGLAGSDPRSNPLSLSNPMTVEQSVMRTSLLPNLLGAVARNLKYDVADVRLFEIGSVFLPSGAELPDEPTRVTAVMAGRRPSWLKPGDEVDFFDLKGALERMLRALLGADAGAVEFIAARDVPYLHPGVCAELVWRGRRLGHLGEVHPRTRAGFEIEAPCFAFDLALDEFPVPTPAHMSTIARFPAVTRDVSFFVAADVPARRVAALIDGAQEALVERYGVLEDFRDAAYVQAGQKGMLWSITYRSPTKTLTDLEVDQAHEAIVERLLTELPAVRR